MTTVKHKQNFTRDLVIRKQNYLMGMTLMLNLLVILIKGFRQTLTTAVIMKLLMHGLKNLKLNLMILFNLFLIQKAVNGLTLLLIVEGGVIMDKVKQEIQKAVEALGYKNFKLEVAPVSYHRLVVFVNDIRIGIYDLDKHTFVD